MDVSYPLNESTNVTWCFYAVSDVNSFGRLPQFGTECIAIINDVATLRGESAQCHLQVSEQKAFMRHEHPMNFGIVWGTVTKDHCAHTRAFEGTAHLSHISQLLLPWDIFARPIFFLGNGWTIFIQITFEHFSTYIRFTLDNFFSHVQWKQFPICALWRHALQGTSTLRKRHWYWGVKKKYWIQTFH